MQQRGQHLRNARVFFNGLADRKGTFFRRTACLQFCPLKLCGTPTGSSSQKVGAADIIILLAAGNKPQSPDKEEEETHGRTLGSGNFRPHQPTEIPGPTSERRTDPFLSIFFCKLVYGIRQRVDMGAVFSSLHSSISIVR